jgi:uncharacterized protein YciI
VPLFVLICTDKPGALPLRMATREAHLAYVDAHPGVVKVAGGRLNEAGEMLGSIIVLEAEDLAGAQAFAAGDPYAKAGLFESVVIDGFRVARGAVG